MRPSPLVVSFATFGVLGELAGLRVALAVVPLAALVIAGMSRTRVAAR